jgi:hypothetical protein
MKLRKRRECRETQNRLFEYRNGDLFPLIPFVVYSTRILTFFAGGLPNSDALKL